MIDRLTTTQADAIKRRLWAGRFGCTARLPCPRVGLRQLSRDLAHVETDHNGPVADCGHRAATLRRVCRAPHKIPASAGIPKLDSGQGDRRRERAEHESACVSSP